MKRFVLPERWVVKASNDEEDTTIVEYINATFGTVIQPGLGSMACWYYSNIPDRTRPYPKHDYGDLSEFSNCTQITFPQFETYVLNKPSNEPHTYDPELEIILKKLLEQ